MEWISVNDRLPETGKDVIVCHKNGHVALNAYLDRRWWYLDDRNKITHWMPLPPAPDVMLNRLAEYEDAEEQGLLVRLPCKLGQEVWVISSGGKVCRGEITKIEENIYTEPTTWLTVEFDSDLVNRCEYSSRIDLMIDKVVFLTQEAAEKALEDA